MGFILEKSLFTVGSQDVPDSRAVAFARYVLMYGDSLYMAPFHYVEAFAFVGNRGLPDPRYPTAGADPFEDRASLGAHWHLNLLTPYWDAEGGLAADVSYQYGVPILGNQHTFQEVYGQVSFVKPMPHVFDWIGAGPVVRWLNDTRFAFRAGGATGLPSNGELFTLGGGDSFRGYDLAERQGSSVWVGSVEWRVPVMKNLDWDFCDHVAGLRNVYLAPFYDVGDSYLKGQTPALGDVAQAVGVGLRLDVVWLGMIERTILRFDVAKTLNGSTPTQFWLGFQQPF
jgi:hemolysin activation/secretion protein